MSEEQRRRLAGEPLQPAALDDLYAWVSYLPDGPGEGILAVVGPVGALPLVASKRETAEQYTSVVADQLAGTGKGARLIRFHRSEILDRLPPT